MIRDQSVSSESQGIVGTEAPGSSLLGLVLGLGLGLGLGLVLVGDPWTKCGRASGPPTSRCTRREPSSGRHIEALV
jgi:hypothetical protein